MCTYNTRRKRQGRISCGFIIVELMKQIWPLFQLRSSSSSRPQNVSNDSRLKFESDWSCYEKGFCFHSLLNCHLGTQLSTQLFVIYDKSFIIKTGMDTSLLCPIHDWWPCWSFCLRPIDYEFVWLLILTFFLPN